MKKILINEQRVICLSAVSVMILVIVDMLIKHYIMKYDANNIGLCAGSDKIFHYHPVYNEMGSYINLKLNLEYKRNMFVVLAFFASLFSLYMLYYLLKKKQIYCYSDMAIIPCVLFISACIGRLVERMRENYTLDYIAIRKIGILDLLDVYFVIGAVGLGVILLRLEYLDKKRKTMLEN